MPTDSNRLDDSADADLVLRFKAGDDRALDVLLQRHSGDLYQLCCRLTPSREDAEDVYQESLVRAIDKVTTLQSGSAFRGWLFRIARNLSADSYRSRKRVCRMPDEEHTPPLLHVEGPHAGIETGEEHVTVSEALRTLARTHQDVLVLREVEGLSYADIADRLQVSKSAVETLLFRARRRLREEYSKRSSGLALLAGLRELVPRLTSPLISGTTVVKVGISAAVVGGAIATSSNVMPHRVIHRATGSIARELPRRTYRVAQRLIPVAKSLHDNSSTPHRVTFRPMPVPVAHIPGGRAVTRRNLRYRRRILTPGQVSTAHRTVGEPQMKRGMRAAARHQAIHPRRTWASISVIGHVSNAARRGFQPLSSRPDVGISAVRRPARATASRASVGSTTTQVQTVRLDPVQSSARGSEPHLDATPSFRSERRVTTARDARSLQFSRAQKAVFATVRPAVRQRLPKNVETTPIIKAPKSHRKSVVVTPQTPVGPTPSSARILSTRAVARPTPSARTTPVTPGNEATATDPSSKSPTTKKQR